MATRLNWTVRNKQNCKQMFKHMFTAGLVHTLMT